MVRRMANPTATLETPLGTLTACKTCTDRCPVPVHGSASCGASGCGMTCDTGYCARDGECVDKQTDVLEARLMRATHRVERAQAQARFLTVLGLEVR